ncbi:NosD domain-containing protein [Paenibacillus ginsengarvi]|nr:right-handed parallel beta-helix repeat-containing protein [Paenibacillus ginsengarvi]
MIGEKDKLSRRKLLASLGVTGAAAIFMNSSLLAAKAGNHGLSVINAAYGPGDVEECNPLHRCRCRKTTIAELRTNSSPDADTLYFVADRGKEGWFVYDPGDTASADNTGTIVVSAAGARFKRVIGDEPLNARWFGAAGDGSTDDTAAIQRALDTVPASGGSVLVPDGVYMINALVALKPNSNTNLLLSPAAILKAIPNAANLYHIVNVINKDRVTIQGGTIMGDRNEHLASTGEHGMGISIRSSRNVTIRDTVIRDCWGDAIYIGIDSGSNQAACENIQILHVTCENNRRQGMSVTSCIGGLAFGSRFIRTNGVEPQSGIDIEPNEGDAVRDFSVVECDCSDNKGSGIAIYGTTADNARDNLLEGNVCDRNTRGIQIRGASYNKVLYNSCSGNTDMGIRVGGNTKTGKNQYNQFIGNSMLGNGTKGIVVEGTSATDIGYNLFQSNLCKGNQNEGINLTHARYCLVTDNQCDGNQFGIRLVGATCLHNDVSGNLIVRNRYGLQLWESSYNKLQGNICNDNMQAGLWLRNKSGWNQILSNTCIGNGQEAHNTYDNLLIAEMSSYNTIQMNTARKGSGTVRPRYGLNISDAASSQNFAINNDLLDGGETASFLDAGTGTITASANRL